MRLKSGGPIMTIQDVGLIEGTENSAKCYWFHDTELKTALFDQSMLKIYEPMQSRRATTSQGWEDI